MFNMMRKITGFCQWGVSKVYNYCKSRHLVIHFSKFPLKRHDFCTIACFAVKSVLINMLIVAVLFLFGKQGRENQRSATQCLFHPGRMSESADYGAKMLAGRSCFRPILIGCVHLRYWAHRVKVKFRPKAIKTHAVRQGEPVSKRSNEKSITKWLFLG